MTAVELRIRLEPTIPSVLVATIWMGFGVKAASSLCTEKLTVVLVVVFELATGIGLGGAESNRGVAHPRRIAATARSRLVTHPGQAKVTGVRTLVTVLVLDEGVAEGFVMLRHRVTEPAAIFAAWLQAALAAVGIGIVNITTKTVTSENLRTARL